MPRVFLPGFVFATCLVACRESAPLALASRAAAPPPPSASGAVATVVPAHPVALASVDAGADPLAMRTMRNIEMVPYCLSYPSALMKEDDSDRGEHGRKAFVLKSGRVGPNRARMVFSGTCGPTALNELFERDQKDIARDAPDVKFSVKALRADSYALSWRKGDRIHYGKLWTAKGDPGCFVRVVFEYGDAERGLFDPIVSRVTASRPDCPDP